LSCSSSLLSFPFPLVFLCTFHIRIIFCVTVFSRRRGPIFFTLHSLPIKLMISWQFPFLPPQLAPTFLKLPPELFGSLSPSPFSRHPFFHFFFFQFPVQRFSRFGFFLGLFFPCVSAKGDALILPLPFSFWAGRPPLGPFVPSLPPPLFFSLKTKTFFLFFLFS